MFHRFAGFAGAAAAIVALSLAASAPAFAQADPVVAKVNGVEIKQSDLTQAEEEIGAENLAGMPEEFKREQLVSYLAGIIAASEAGEKKKLQDGAKFKERLTSLRRRLLASMYIEEESKAAVTDKAMREVYDDVVKQQGGEEVHARHILFATPDPKDDKAVKAAEDKAKAVVARIKKGEDFLKLADELTEDPSGKGKGGDLGFFGKGQMVPEFADAAFKLNKGQTSEPVKSQFGWHVIKVEDKRMKEMPSFETVKPQIEKHVAERARGEVMEKLRTEAKIEKMYQTPAAPGAPKQ